MASRERMSWKARACDLSGKLLPKALLQDTFPVSREEEVDVEQAVDQVLGNPSTHISRSCAARLRFYLM